MAVNNVDNQELFQSKATHSVCFITVLHEHHKRMDNEKYLHEEEQRLFRQRMIDLQANSE